MNVADHPPEEAILAWATTALGVTGMDVTDPAAAGVRAHLDACPECRAIADVWSQVNSALSAWSAGLPAPRPLVVTDVAAGMAGAGVAAMIRHGLAVIGAQVPVVRRRVWAATALVVGIGCLVVTVSGAAVGTVLALTAPVAAAFGLAGIYGPDCDPCVEVSRSCPVPARTVLLARLGLVAGYDLAVTFAATVALASTAAGAGLWSLIASWLGPLMVLSGFSVLLSVVFRPSLGAAAALLLWAIRVGTLSPSHSALLSLFTSWLWATTPVTAAVAATAMTVAVMAIGRRERLA